jgi:hypothetical protein
MTLAELRCLVAVADLRHFGRAADRCNVTPADPQQPVEKAGGGAWRAAGRAHDKVGDLDAPRGAGRATRAAPISYRCSSTSCI